LETKPLVHRRLLQSPTLPAHTDKWIFWNKRETLHQGQLPLARHTVSLINLQRQGPACFHHHLMQSTSTSASPPLDESALGSAFWGMVSGFIEQSLVLNTHRKVSKSLGSLWQSKLNRTGTLVRPKQRADIIGDDHDIHINFLDYLMAFVWDSTDKGTLVECKRCNSLVQPFPLKPIINNQRSPGKCACPRGRPQFKRLSLLQLPWLETTLQKSRKTTSEKKNFNKPSNQIKVKNPFSLWINLILQEAKDVAGLEYNPGVIFWALGKTCAGKQEAENLAPNHVERAQGEIQMRADVLAKLLILPNAEKEMTQRKANIRLWIAERLRLGADRNEALNESEMAIQVVSKRHSEWRERAKQKKSKAEQRKANLLLVQDKPSSSKEQCAKRHRDVPTTQPPVYIPPTQPAASVPIAPILNQSQKGEGSSRGTSKEGPPPKRSKVDVLQTDKMPTNAKPESKAPVVPILKRHPIMVTEDVTKEVVSLGIRRKRKLTTPVNLIPSDSL
jgi:hypothetical protein